MRNEQLTLRHRSQSHQHLHHTHHPTFAQISVSLEVQGSQYLAGMYERYCGKDVFNGGRPREP